MVVLHHFHGNGINYDLELDHGLNFMVTIINGTENISNTKQNANRNQDMSKPIPIVHRSSLGFKFQLCKQKWHFIRFPWFMLRPLVKIKKNKKPWKWPFEIIMRLTRIGWSWSPGIRTLLLVKKKDLFTVEWPLTTAFWSTFWWVFFFLNFFVRPK